MLAAPPQLRTMFTMTPAPPTKFRRGVAWSIDAAVVGLPAVLIGIAIPVLPVGIVLWTVYRCWTAWRGRSLGRTVARIRLVRPDGSEPRARGLVHAALAALPAATACLAVAVAVSTLSFDPWYLWLFFLPAIFAVAAAIGALVALVIWTGAPRIDRWCKLAVHSTRPVPS